MPLLQTRGAGSAKGLGLTAAAATAATYVEDVFSTQLYTGAGTSASDNKVIDNDIALASTAAWKTRTIIDGTSTYIYKVKKDTAGNYIVLGNSVVSSIYRVLVIKFDSAWNILWQKRISQDATSQTVSAEALALDPSDNIYAAFGNEGGAASLVKLNSSGDLQWARAIEPSSGSGRYLNTVIYNTVDGFLYVGGRTSGPGGPGLYAKYNTSGTIQWMFKYKPAGTYYGNQQSGYVKSMAHDSAGNVYFCGAEFDGGWKGHVVKINSSGTVQWNKRVSGTTSGVDAIFIDSSDNLYIGYWDGVVFAAVGYAYTDVHTTKLNTSTGAIVWDRKFVGYPGGPGIAAITGDSSGNIYTNMYATIIKHNSSGTFQWSRRVHPNPGAVGFYGVSAIDSKLYGTGLTNPSVNGFITELALDGTTTSGTAYHTITGDVLDSAGSQTVSDGNSVFETHTGAEQASTATVSTASTTVTTYTQDAVIGSGGLVWTKGRSSGYGNGLFDTVRGQDYWLNSGSTDGQTIISAIPANPWILSFNIDGFTVGTNGSTNNSGTTYASWTFRKKSKFFDIVTYTGNGIAGMVNHNLESTPGMILYKNTSGTSNWAVYHRSLGGTKSLFLNGAGSTDTGSGYFGNQSATSTQFPVGTNDLANGSGTFVAYLFAHDAGGFGLNGTDSIVSCGSCTIAAGYTVTTVEVGFEPQWLLMKRTDSNGGWFIFDTMRGMPVSGTTRYLYAQTADPEDTGGLNAYVTTTATGFKAYQFVTAGEYVYMAIRRPMEIPTDATKVFLPVLYTGNGSTNTITTGFPVDFMINRVPAGVNANYTVMSRMFGFGSASDSTLYLFTNTDAAQGNASAGLTTMGNNGITFGSWGQVNTNTTIYVNWMFRRAPGFFDEVHYTGNGSAGGQTITHNLTVTPELIILKQKSNTINWRVYAASQGVSAYAALNSTAAFATDANNPWQTPTSTTFGVGDGTYWTSLNGSGGTFVAYLFATCPGVSKVGSYTGTGTTLNIECGFSAGARFVLIKRTDSTGNWFVWDTARGIASGNDPYLLINDKEYAEVTNTDYIDPYSPGFTLSSTAPAALNASGGTYIFLAIA